MDPADDSAPADDPASFDDPAPLEDPAPLDDPAPLEDPAPAGSPFAPPPPPQVEQPAAAKSSNKGRLIAVVVAVIAVVAAAVSFVLYRQAVDDTNSANEALARTEAQLVEANEQKAESEAGLESTVQELDEAQASLAEAEQSLTAKDAELTAAQAELAEAQAALTESQASLDESEALVERYTEATTAFLALSIETGTGADEAAARCVAEAIVDSVGPGALELLIAASQGESDGVAQLGTEMIAAAPGCNLPDDFFDDEIAFAYGDDPALDALYDDCAAGSGAACDELFYASAVGSEYETFAITCGGRFDITETPEFCDDGEPTATEL